MQKSILILLLFSAALFAQDSTFNKIVRMRDSVSIQNITRHIENLQSAGGHTSRVTFTPGNDSAAVYIYNEFAKIPGLIVQVDSFYFTDATPPYNTKVQKNIIATVPGKNNSTKMFIIGAHYDDSGSRIGTDIWNNGWDTITVPGADDNATGVAGILEMARLFCDTSIAFYNDYTITFVAYAGEEGNPMTTDHHYGSKRHAQYCSDNAIQVAGMISFDMVGYNKNHYYTSIAGNTNSSWLGSKINQCRNLFDIQLTTNDPPYLDGDYSDHKSYEDKGYKAVLLIENAWPWDNGLYYAKNPFYHKSTDSLQTVNLELTARVTQLTLVTAASFAGVLTDNNEVNSVPEEFFLSQNYPNPFNPTTRIDFTMPQRNNIQLKVFDILGNEIVTLYEGEAEAGSHSVQFDGKNLASGIYIFRAVSENFNVTRKMLLLK